jgi:hypothetical protein
VGTAPPKITGPGFVAVMLDVPFPISIPGGAYMVFDPIKGVAAIEVSLLEGSRAFFRNMPIKGPTSFAELQKAGAAMERRGDGRSYIAASRLPDGTQKSTLNIHTGDDGGFAECKYFSRMSVTFLADDIGIISRNDHEVEKRTFEILNPFLDKYRLLNEDYRISPVSSNRNFYAAVCQTSPLTSDEQKLTADELFKRLSTPREFSTVLGHGAANIIRANSYELLGPRSQLSASLQKAFDEFIRKQYEMPLSYSLILESLANLQRTQDYRLAIMHAETAFEVHTVNRLLKLMVDQGMKLADAAAKVETDNNFWGVKRKIKQLDAHIQSYCAQHKLGFTAFVGSALYGRWEKDLYKHRNEAVHAGANAFTYGQAHAAIGIAKECIIAIESQLPTIADPIQLNPLMTGFRQNPGEVMF